MFILYTLHMFIVYTLHMFIVYTLHMFILYTLHVYYTLFEICTILIGHLMSVSCNDKWNVQHMVDCC